jgi:hypothetical protein
VFTTRLYAKLLFDMQTPHIKLREDQYRKLLSAYKNSIYQMKRLSTQIEATSSELDYSIDDNPFFLFLENFQIQIAKFQPIDSNIEFNRMLS